MMSLLMSAVNNYRTRTMMCYTCTTGIIGGSVIPSKIYLQGNVTNVMVYSMVRC